MEARQFVLQPYAGTNVRLVSNLFAALSLAAIGDRRSIPRLEEYREFIHTAARSCQENFQAWLLIVDAEILRLDDDASAMPLYLSAMRELLSNRNPMTYGL